MTKETKISLLISVVPIVIFVATMVYAEGYLRADILTTKNDSVLLKTRYETTLEKIANDHDIIIRLDTKLDRVIKDLEEIKADAKTATAAAAAKIKGP